MTMRRRSAAVVLFVLSFGFVFILLFATLP